MPFRELGAPAESDLSKPIATLGAMGKRIEELELGAARRRATDGGSRRQIAPVNGSIWHAFCTNDGN